MEWRIWNKLLAFSYILLNFLKSNIFDNFSIDLVNGTSFGSCGPSSSHGTTSTLLRLFPDLRIVRSITACIRFPPELAACEQLSASPRAGAFRSQQGQSCRSRGRAGRGGSGRQSAGAWIAARRRGSSAGGSGA